MAYGTAPHGPPTVVAKKRWRATFIDQRITRRALIRHHGVSPTNTERMGQSWQRPQQEPRLGRVEVWVERARNLAPELHETINTWTDEARVRVVLMLMGEERCLWRAESESKVRPCMRGLGATTVGV